jgi:hypothetical protein
VPAACLTAVLQGLDARSLARVAAAHSALCQAVQQGVLGQREVGS